MQQFFDRKEQSHHAQWLLAVHLVPGTNWYLVPGTKASIKLCQSPGDIPGPGPTTCV